MKKKVSYFLYCAVVVWPLLEGLLRVAGYRPYRYQDFSITSNPKHSIIADPVYGLALNPGQFTVTINHGLTYKATHLSKFTRRSVVDSSGDDNIHLAVFGCSYTYGMGVDDGEAFPVQLSERRDEYKVNSYAVPGYGTVQGYMQLQELTLAGRKPDVALFNFAGFHLDRNSLTPAYRLHLNVGYQHAVEKQISSMHNSSFPYVRLENDSLLFLSEKWSDLYENWTGRETFALINLLQTITDRYETAAMDPEKNTLALFREIRDFCEEQEIRFIVAGITSDQTTTDLMKKLSAEGIETADLSLPLEKEVYNNLPFDSHPNSLAHRLMAEKMSEYLLGPLHTASR